MRAGLKVITICLGSCFFAAILSAQDDMWPGGTYDPKVPTPESVLGYKLGAKHTPHFLMEKYMQAVAASTDRIKVKVVGETYQGRKQYYVIISAPENLARLEDIRETNLRLTDPDLSEAELDSIAGSIPAIALLGYNVHGNEASGAESALRTIYQLAAGTDETTLKILRDVVTLIDPVQNPDGHDRYVNGVNDYLVAQVNPDTQSYEHDQPWPGSRSNAYYFDLNRDWYLMTQVESVNRVREYLQWLPHVAADLHEMGTNSTYYFAPPMLPYNWNIPQVTHKWWEIYGQGNAAAFDIFGWTYYTRESFDSFYPGYGEALPCFLGAVGMTYEQASARGRASERRDGTVLSLHDATWHHFMASMSTLKTTAERRDEKIRDFHRFFLALADQATKGPIREFYIPPADPLRVNKMVQRLQWMGGKVYRAKAQFTAKQAYDYLTRKTGDVNLPAGTVIVPVGQMSGFMLKTVLEPECTLDEEFLKEERERIRRDESGRFYDVTGWSLPLTYGLQAYWGGGAAVEKELIAEISSVKPDPAPIPRAKVAYLIPPDTNANIALVGRLLSEDFKVRVARLEFTLEGRKYVPGTAVLRVERNPETLHERLNALAKETGGYAVAADTGYTPEGIDLGSNNVLAVKKPKIAILAGNPTSSSNFGVIRYLFEQVYKLPYTAVAASDFNSSDMSKYNVLILPTAWGFGGNSYKGLLGKRGIEKLQGWVRDGGVLVCIEGAVDFAADEEVQLTKAPKYKQREKKPGETADAYGEKPPAVEEKKEQPEKGKEGKPPEQKFEVDELLYTPGAIVKVMLDDRSHLSWGYGKFVSALIDSRNVFVPISDDQGIAAGRYATEGEILLSGHIWPEMKKLLAGKAYVWHERFGRGQVICFAEDPVFRASYDGLDRLFFNAVIFSLAFAP
jgi:hypothetical protein